MKTLAVETRFLTALVTIKICAHGNYMDFLVTTLNDPNGNCWYPGFSCSKNRIEAGKGDHHPSSHTTKTNCWSTQDEMGFTQIIRLFLSIGVGMHFIDTYITYIFHVKT